MKLAVFAALVAVASAACPNQCNGKGYCDENDRCICYRAPGTKGQLRAAYTGADCSQRVCPFGRSHDYISDATQELLDVNKDTSNSKVALINKGNTDSTAKLEAFLNNGFLLEQDIGVDVQVVSVDTTLQRAKFQYKLNSERTFNYEEDLIAGVQYSDKKTAYHVMPTINGEVRPTGLFIYFDVTAADLSEGSQKVFAGDRYYMNVTFNEGIKFASDDLNSAHGQIECSGRGLCDRSAGVCKCVKGYTGDACQRTECPNDCSGHGTCQSLKYFVEDAEAGIEYNAFDAEGQMGCKCDDGFRGADCSQVECPSGADPLKGDGGAEGRDCSGRGVCDYTAGLCQCFKGFTGERCEEATNLV